MQISPYNYPNKSTSFAGFLDSKILRKTLETASNNGVLFASATTLLLSGIVRPIAILSAPNTETENKQYACAKSIASSITKFFIAAGISIPIAAGIKNIAQNPQKFLNQKTIQAFTKNETNIQNSKSFNFASKLINLSSNFIAAIPKAVLTSALVVPIVHFIFPEKKQNQNSQLSFGSNLTNTSFNQKITNKISNTLSKIFSFEPFQKFSEKYKDSNVSQHMFSLNDAFLTGIFVYQNTKNKDIPDNRKKTLNYNAIISTGLTIIGGYILNSLLKKPTEIFTEKFKQANKSYKNLDTALKGIDTAKSVFILGGLYYILFPIVSTMLAEKYSQNTDNPPTTK